MLKNFIIGLMSLLLIASWSFATDFAKRFWIGNGTADEIYFFHSRDVGSDSATTVDHDTIFSNPVQIAPYLGAPNGTIEFWSVETVSDTLDTVAIKHLIQVGNQSGTDGYSWTTYSVSDTLYASYIRYAYSVDWSRLGSYEYMRTGFIPTINIDTTYINQDETYGTCIGIFPLNPNYTIEFDKLTPGESKPQTARRKNYENQ